MKGWNRGSVELSVRVYQAGESGLSVHVGKHLYMVEHKEGQYEVTLQLADDAQIIDVHTDVNDAVASCVAHFLESE